MEIRKTTFIVYLIIFEVLNVIVTVLVHRKVILNLSDNICIYVIATVRALCAVD